MSHPFGLFLVVGASAMLALGGALMYASAASRESSTALFVIGSTLLGAGAGVVSWLAG